MFTDKYNTVENFTLSRQNSANWKAWSDEWYQIFQNVTRFFAFGSSSLTTV